jgi:hypothetical protein
MPTFENTREYREALDRDHRRTDELREYLLATLADYEFSQQFQALYDVIASEKFGNIEWWIDVLNEAKETKEIPMSAKQDISGE